MNRFIILIISVLCFGSNIQAQFSKATLQATGLTCALCSNAINKALGKLPFVESVQSDIKNTAFNIRFKSGSEVNVDALKTAVENAGFSIGSLKLTGNFQNLKVQNDQHIRIGNANYHFLNIKDQVLHGEKTITIVDKNFVSDKFYKVVKSYSNKACVQTGKASHCCPDVVTGSRIYHVTI
ncbi:hypothetical protein PIECOFPK_00796 [Mycovorax composti]|uniref:HMA domain-containing protein n=2 Tax=Chitinophagaceae TaxID=563835 RepID=A0ABZ2EI20_9BACT